LPVTNFQHGSDMKYKLISHPGDAWEHLKLGIILNIQPLDKDYIQIQAGTDKFKRRVTWIKEQLGYKNIQEIKTTLNLPNWW
jgi:hypothetical protein